MSDVLLLRLHDDDLEGLKHVAIYVPMDERWYNSTDLFAKILVVFTATARIIHNYKANNTEYVTFETIKTNARKFTTQTVLICVYMQVWVRACNEQWAVSQIRKQATAQILTLFISRQLLNSTCYKPSARGYNWATLFLGDINTGTWLSRLGES
jgi:hypothetical protein